MCDLCGGSTFCQLNVCSDCKSSIDNMEQNFNNLQQLKAEIRAIHDSLQEAAAENDTECFEDCLVRLRKLSAI